MTAITHRPRFFSRRNRRHGARAGLLAIAIQLLVALTQALPALADDGTGIPGADKFICVVYKSGTKAPAPTPETGRTGPGGHAACPICILSAPGAGAPPTHVATLAIPAPMGGEPTLAPVDLPPVAALLGHHGPRAPPFSL